MRSSFVRSRGIVLVVSAALIAFALPMTTAVAVDARVQVAGAFPIPSTDTIVNRSISTSFDVALKGAHDAQLTTFLADLSNPSSPTYQHFVSTAQFAERFGASPTTVAAVARYFATYDVHVGQLSKGRVLLHLNGNTANIARAFATSITTVRRSDGVLAAQFAAPASLPRALARDVVGVAGLSSVVTPMSNQVRPHLSHVAALGTCPGAGSQLNIPNAMGGYPAQTQAKLYGLSTAWANGFTGSGQTIAVYELGTYDAADVAVFASCYGVTPALTAANVDGGAPLGFSDEATLDVEEAMILAPGAAVKVYQGPNTGSGPADVYQSIADQNVASIVTTSWGTCEADPTGDVIAEQPVFEQMAAQGQTVIAAAGDNGSSDCNGITTNAPAVDDPASQPYVTGVGGLTVNSISPLQQSVWNNGIAGGGAGGGRSAVWSRPSWQVAPGINSNETMRLVPDLSVMADPSTGFIQYFTGTPSGVCGLGCTKGWGSIGGTSIGSPLVSALVAVAAQSCGVSRLGFINPALYRMATTGFVDVTSGTNDVYGVGSYSAGPGFDLASGLGSPNGAAFINGLCPAKYDTTKSSFSVSAPTALTNGAGVHVTATLHNSNNSPLADAAVNVSATSVVAGANGRLLIDGDVASALAVGQAAYAVTTDATGTAAFDLTATAPGPVTLAITFGSATIYSSTVTFTAAPLTSTVPGRPSIAKLTANVGGFLLSVRAPTSNGRSPITSYQYSLTAGTRWSSFKNYASLKIGNLVKGKLYRVIVRAINMNGASIASAAESIVTLKK